MSDEKCLVKGCPNRRTEGVFKGDLCHACHHMLSEGRIGPSQAWFVTRIEKLENALAGHYCLKLERGMSCPICEALKEGNYEST